MNVDTDTQYAFTRPVASWMMKNYDGSSRSTARSATRSSTTRVPGARRPRLPWPPASSAPARTCVAPAPTRADMDLLGTCRRFLTIPRRACSPRDRPRPRSLRRIRRPRWLGRPGRRRPDRGTDRRRLCACPYRISPRVGRARRPAGAVKVRSPGRMSRTGASPRPGGAGDSLRAHRRGRRGDPVSDLPARLLSRSRGRPGR